MTDDRCILVLDEGTTSTHAVPYTLHGAVIGVAREDLSQH
jgi:glycerol kinase